MTLLHPLSRSTPQQGKKYCPPKNRHNRRKRNLAMYAIYDLTNCSTSAAIKTCCQDRPYITPPGTITYKSPDPSFIFVAHGRTKKTSDELFEQFKPKPPARKSRKVIHSDPDAVSKRTRSNVRPVSTRTRSKETNPPSSAQEERLYRNGWLPAPLNKKH